MRRIIASFWLLLCGILNVNGFDLQCTFKTLVNLFEFANRTGCSASNVNIQSRDQVVTSVNGKDLKSFTGSGYKSLEIRNQPVHYIPQGLGEFFPDLEGLDIAESQTKEVIKNDLAQFPKLKQLYLYSTKLQSLPADLFEGNPELLCFYLGQNKLTHVGRGILTPVKKLHTAHFKPNPCINMGIVKDQSKIPSLVAALESGCRNDTIDELNEKTITKIQYQSAISSLTAVIEEFKIKLQSKENIIDAATHHIFKNPSCSQEKSSLISIKTIDIKCKFSLVDSSCKAFDLVVNTSGSKIAEIVNENGTKIDQTSSPIKKLLIIEQQTLFLPQNLAEMLPKLTELLITDSGFFQIDEGVFNGLTDLKLLEITQSKIREIPEHFMSENSNLKELNLTSNRIEVIAESAFLNLGKLEQLDLRNNLLIAVLSEVFSPLASLKTLKVNDNKLQFLSPRLFYAIPELISLDISNNQIEKLEGDLVSASNKILEFRAANNKIKIIDQMLMKRLKNSQLIDFSGNDCINTIHDKNSTTSVTLIAMVSEIYLECTEDGEKFFTCQCAMP